MTDSRYFWTFILCCALISALCRLLPLLINVETLPASLQSFITRLAKYISVALLVNILVAALWQLGQLQGAHYQWIIPVALAWLLGLTPLKSGYAFLIALACWGGLLWW
ncbi:Predicted membrane protein [Serratia rubidaea]|uniref:Predicted membrane protein n=1 Tax=Serratia rubidaea TaxID=61652 RepID=A0A3S4H4P0_SERRU|nr:hypothetical protein [Serratia rubidaea]MCR0996770.1 hypothetical protein [Serratia rubidaea]QPR63832.1 hypothetical protein I6G83_00785 [Serratia rubidaea]CAI1050770.1 Predicted membrane protein [Serratia rubidaea]CAI1816462.1 Predicted membrane protein [Serratia rubidaea]VEA69462.1 Predicted membrane protein [Serratia rubidaea]